jgi:DNA (cytosine-5)-methyltransferase 1
MNYIELFAGCGGLSLGLKSVGFNLIMANELSPMAAESYSFNFFDEDLDKESKSSRPNLKKTLWLSSKYERKALKGRLREDPRDFPSIGDGFCDINSDGSNIKGSLIVGSIVELNKWLINNPNALNIIKHPKDSDGIDVVSGGPPCQSFSMAGLRQLESEKNSLPWEFAKFVNTVKPKIALLENVTGILRPFKDNNGRRFYAWFEVAKAFSEIGYIPLCLHINAKMAGVPQNRPRFILIGVREDVLNKIKENFSGDELKLFESAINLFNKIKLGEDAELDDLTCWDVARAQDVLLFKNTFLKPLVVGIERPITVGDAIEDLRENGSKKSSYPKNLNKTFSIALPSRKIENHELRTNSPLVRRRFRLYQILQHVGNDTRKNILMILKGESHHLNDDDWFKIVKFDFLNEYGGYSKFENKEEFLVFLDKHNTKKQTQKALLENLPAPAALSIPDDACHYHHDEQRTLTVREMARIQSFPDSFVFRSKITTGGKMRSFEVPQYTQVGNAVPPLLGRALGLVIKDLLIRAD